MYLIKQSNSKQIDLIKSPKRLKLAHYVAKTNEEVKNINLPKLFKFSMDIRGLVWVLTGRSTKQTKEEVVEKWVWISGRQASLYWPFLRQQITQKIDKDFFVDFLKSFGIFFFKASSAVDPPFKIEARSFEVYSQKSSYRAIDYKAQTIASDSATCRMIKTRFGLN